MKGFNKYHIHTICKTEFSCVPFLENVPRRGKDTFCGPYECAFSVQKSIPQPDCSLKCFQLAKCDSHAFRKDVIRNEHRSVFSRHDVFHECTCLLVKGVVTAMERNNDTGVKENGHINRIPLCQSPGSRACSHKRLASDPAGSPSGVFVSRQSTGALLRSLPVPSLHPVWPLVL